jgi:hypothetical protein
MSDITETETETGTNTDTTDEPSKAELHERVEQLESTVEKLMPSRRDALRMGVAGLAGAAGLGAATQPADASTGSAGTIGSNSDRPDLIADDVGPRSIADDYLYAGEFSGGGADARLDNALSAASKGTTIYLENATYTSNHTIASNSVSLIGGGSRSNGSVIRNATFDFTGNAGLIQNVGADTSDGSTAIRLNFGGQATNIRQTGAGNGTIEFSAGRCVAMRLKDIDLIINGNNCVLDASTGVTVTDNGNGSVVGDVS